MFGASVLAAMLLGTFGCGTEVKKVDPKPAEGQSVDPRIKPAEAGGTGSPAQPKNPGPAQNPAPVKGD
jgi:hypothetical protein